MDLKLAEGVTPGSVTLATVDQPEPEPMLPAGDQEKGSTETSAIEGSSEGQLKQSSLPTLSSSSTSDGVLDVCDESADNSESLEVREQVPVSEIVPKGETGEQQTKPEWSSASTKQRTWRMRELQSYELKTSALFHLQISSIW